MKLNSRFLPLLVAVLLLMQIIDPSRVWMLLLAGLGGAWLVSYLWARDLRRHLRLRREMRFGWVQVGDRLEERFTLSAEGWAPALWAEISDHSTLPGYQVGQVTGVGSHGQNQWRTGGQCQQRGLYQLGPTQLDTGDPLGVYRVRISYPATVSLLVMPPIVPLPAIEVAPGGRTADGRPRPNAPERTLSSASVRPYQPGDSLRWLHWRTTARREAPYVRILEGTPAGDWWLALNLDRQVQVGAGWDSTEEHGVILAASLADRGLRLRRAVGLVCNSQPPTWMAPQPSEPQRFAILRALALARPGEMRLAELLTSLRPALRRQSSLVIITPATAEADWVEALIPLLWRGVAPTVLLLDPASYAPSADPTAAQRLASLLTELGIQHYTFSRGLLDRPEARPGHAGDWGWQKSPRGRAVARRQLANSEWKALG
jgi:uncharacterized protein (DUF58 family)